MLGSSHEQIKELLNKLKSKDFLNAEEKWYYIVDAVREALGSNPIDCFRI